MPTTIGATAAATSSASAEGTPPATPRPAASSRYDQYEMEDSPRHSRDSSSSLLGGHERTASLDSTYSSRDEAGRLLGPSSSAAGAAGGDLHIIQEDEDDDEEAYDSQGGASSRRSGNGSRAQPVDKRKLYEGDGNDGDDGGLIRGGARRLRSRSFSKATAGIRKVVMENRGLLMIILSQACFAAMNVMVRPEAVNL